MMTPHEGQSDVSWLVPDSSTSACATDRAHADDVMYGNELQVYSLAFSSITIDNGINPWDYPSNKIASRRAVVDHGIDNYVMTTS